MKNFIIYINFILLGVLLGSLLFFILLERGLMAREVEKPADQAYGAKRGAR